MSHCLYRTKWERQFLLVARVRTLTVPCERQPADRWGRGHRMQEVGVGGVLQPLGFWGVPPLTSGTKHLLRLLSIQGSRRTQRFRKMSPKSDPCPTCLLIPTDTASQDKPLLRIPVTIAGLPHSLSPATLHGSVWPHSQRFPSTQAMLEPKPVLSSLGSSIF